MNSRGHSLRPSIAAAPSRCWSHRARPYGGQIADRSVTGYFATAGLFRRATAAPAVVASRSGRRSRLEAVLFLSREPLGLRKLAQSANLADATEARTLLAELRGIYDRRGCAFQVEQLAGGYQLRTRPKFAPWLRPLVPPSEQIRLTPPSLETLAVVAYRQPVLRADVEAIRGVACGEIFRQLMERDLLRIVGRSEELGRPCGTEPRSGFWKCLVCVAWTSCRWLPRCGAWRKPCQARQSGGEETATVGWGAYGRRLGLVIV